MASTVTSPERSLPLWAIRHTREAHDGSRQDRQTAAAQLMETREIAVGAFMEAVERLGVTIALRIDEGREQLRGEHRPWTVVLAGSQFGEAGAIRADFANLSSCLGFAAEQVGELGQLELTHQDDRDSPPDLDDATFEELLVGLAASGVGFSIQRNHLASGYFTTPWRVLVSGAALGESIAIEEGDTFHKCIGLGLKWLRSRLDDGEWLDLYL